MTRIKRGALIAVAFVAHALIPYKLLNLIRLSGLAEQERDNLVDTRLAQLTRGTDNPLRDAVDRRLYPFGK
jgi:hypothetical protein